MASPSICLSERVGFYGNSIGGTGPFLGLTETVFQNVFESLDRETGAVRYRKDIREAQIGDWLSVCPSTAGGHNWPSTSFHPESKLLIAPLSQSCMEIAGQDITIEAGRGGSGAVRMWMSMPGKEDLFGKWLPMT
ncbi:MAG: hypothetical protein CM1200mP14_12870 [Gammaproteobacteria bacterium]|nr:MAG: hypothetical protein CM1200mP14_12870 [Gammaproteobacteria bacterium]